ncbi:MAG: hypothetical protein ACRC1M_07935 [Methanobacteriaceae archaeon]
MKNKIIVLVIILISISGIGAYMILSENTNNPVKTFNNDSNLINNSTNQSNSINDKGNLSKTIKIKDDPNLPTSEKIGNEDTIYAFYNSGYNGQEDIHRGLIIFILNSSNELEGNTNFKISQAVIKFKDNNSKIVYKTYTPNYGDNIKIKVPENLTPLTATVYYKI